MTFKPYLPGAANVMLLPHAVRNTSPLRRFYRESMAYGVYAAYTLALDDCGFRTQQQNVRNFVRFMDCCQAKFDLSHKVATMFGSKGFLN